MEDIVLVSKTVSRKYIYGICEVTIDSLNNEYDAYVAQYLKLNCFIESYDENINVQFRFHAILDAESQKRKYGFEDSKFKRQVKIHNKTKFEDEKYANYYEDKSIIYYHNIKLNTYVRYNKTDNTIIILGNEENTAIQILDLMREQIVQKTIESNGLFYLKCAAFTYNEFSKNTCLLIGAQGSGKTSILLNILQRNIEYQYVCNSAAYLQLKKEVELLAWRPHMRIRAGTAYQFPILRSKMGSEFFEDNRILDKYMSEDAIFLKTYDEFHSVFPNKHCEFGIPKIVFLINETKDNWCSHLRCGYDLAHPDFLGLEQRYDYSSYYRLKYNQIKQALMNQFQFIQIHFDFNNIDSIINQMRGYLI